MGIVAAVFFAPLYHHPLDMDDAAYIMDSAAVSKYFATFFSGEKKFAGRPVTEFLFWLIYEIVGADTSIFHIIVILFHYLASIALVLLCRKLNINLGLSFLTGFLFLINFAHFRAIYWIAAVAYPLAFIFSCSAIICCLYFIEKENDKWLIGVYIASLLRTLSHASAILTWLFCLFVIWQHHSSPNRGALKLFPLALLLSGVVIAVILLYPDPPQIVATVRFPSPRDVLTNLFWFWGRLLTTAYWISVTLHTLQNWELFIGGILIVSALLVFFREDKQSPLRTWISCRLYAAETLLGGEDSCLPLWYA